MVLLYRALSASSRSNSRLFPLSESPSRSRLQGQFNRFRSVSSVAPPQPLKDPSHPSLYYHLFSSRPHPLPTGSVYALSFLETRPKHLKSETILGWLPAHTRHGQEATLEDFVQNDRFVSLLHGALSHAVWSDPFWVNSALAHQQGWMHIFDHRAPPPAGRIPDPSDILASVLVSESKIQPGTYQPMPTYRLCTADGVCVLTTESMEEVRRAIEGAHDQETDA